MGFGLACANAHISRCFLLHKQLSNLSLPDASVALKWLLAWDGPITDTWLTELLELQGQLLIKPMLVLLRVEQLIVALPALDRKRLRGCIRANRKRRRDRALQDEKVFLAVDRHTFACLLAVQSAVQADTFENITLNDLVKLSVNSFSGDV